MWSWRPTKALVKPTMSVAIEGAEDLAAGVIGDDESDVGFGVEFGFAPDLAGDLDAAVEFVERVEMADGDVGGHGCCPLYVISFGFGWKVERSEIGEWKKGDEFRREVVEGGRRTRRDRRLNRPTISALRWNDGIREETQKASR